MENFYTPFLISRGDRIRTYDPLVPNQVFYRTELHPETSFSKADAKVSILFVVRKEICKFYTFLTFTTPSAALVNAASPLHGIHLSESAHHVLLLPLNEKP